MNRQLIVLLYLLLLYLIIVLRKSMSASFCTHVHAELRTDPVLFLIDIV